MKAKIQHFGNARSVWAVNPVTKVVGSKKAYDRKKEKGKVRNELQKYR